MKYSDSAIDVSFNKFNMLSDMYNAVKAIWLLPYKIPFLEKYIYPFQYFFNITNQCNLSCYYCHNKQARFEAKKELSTQEILNIIKKLPIYSLIVLSGGEPLMRKDFLQIISGIADLKKQQALVTNGLLLDDEIIKNIIKCRVLNIGISVDGNQKYFDSIKGRGNYAKLIMNIEKINHYKKIMNSKFPLVDFKVTVCPENLEFLSELLQLSDKLHANTITFSLLKKNNYQFNDLLKDISILSLEQEKIEKNFVATPEFQKKVIAAYLQIITNAKKYTVVPRFNPYIRRLHDISNIFSPNAVTEKYCNCFEPWVGLHINPQGDTYPCLSIKTGSLKSQTLKEILFGNTYTAIRKVIRKQGILNICDSCCWAKCKNVREKQVV